MSESGLRKPSAASVRRWRRYLAAERAEAMIYRDLGGRRKGEEQAILLALAEAEDRHAQHWIELLGPAALPEPRVDPASRVLGWFAKRFGSVFVLALMQRAEGRSPYDGDSDATEAMAADEHIHSEVVRALAQRKRVRLAGGFRAAVFGMNDGLVSNLALVMGVGATGLAPNAVLFTGVAGLLAGALSMAAGEYISVSSSRELVDASKPDPESEDVLADLDFDANELALVYRARGLPETDAVDRADAVFAKLRERGRLAADGNELDAMTSQIPIQAAVETPDDHDAVGSPWAAALSSFVSFAAGAVIPVIPYFFGGGLVSVIVAAVLVGIALCITGAITGILSGASPWWRALRQLAIGYAAAAVTYVLGLAFGQILA